MALSRTAGEFARRIDVHAFNLVKNVEETIRKAALAADQEAVLRTPVDTGRARANWIVSLGAPAQRERKFVESGERKSSARRAANAQKSLNQANQTIGRFNIKRRSIFITNSVEYITFLEQGSSAQASRGMLKFAIRRARWILNAAKILGK